MASHPSIPDPTSVQPHPRVASRHHIAPTLKAFFTAIMGLLSIFVFGLSLEYKSVFWLWIGFVCALIAGFFVQCLINQNKTLR